jgi:8-oxo-dGTP pyrophosphatase MutT (NUDIX family)
VFSTFVQALSERMILLREAPVARQAGAIPYKRVEDEVAFLLITSRRSGRWIFPKGRLRPGSTLQESAAAEALEEAGVEGRVGLQPLGTYRTVKTAVRRYVIEVEHFPLEVEEQHEDWPEKGQRHRHWVLLPEAKRLIADHSLTDIVVQLHEQLKNAA